MTETKLTLCAATGAIGIGVSYLFGDLDAILLTLIVFIALDFVSGFIRATVKKELESRVFYIGGVKKIGILTIVAVATQLDRLVLGDTIILRDVTMSYYIVNEALSILENYGSLGLPLPSILRKTLKKLNDDVNNENNQNK